MNHRKFVFISSLLMAVVGVVVGGLAFYTSYVVKASIPGLPEAIAYLPEDSQAVFGMNVQKFVASPIYAKFDEKHGKEFAGDLADFIAKTGVDPRRDMTYVLAAGRAGSDFERSGVIIAVGYFNATTITSYIYSKFTPEKVEYKATTFLMCSEKNGSKVEKGIAFLSDTEIAVGDLKSLQGVVDVRAGTAPGVLSNKTLAPLIRAFDPQEMFWFAGDATNILAKAPKNMPFESAVASLQTVVGTLNLTDAVTGKITVTATDEEAARKLADVARGVVALGQLAGDHDANVAELMKGVSVTQDKTQIRLVVNFPIDLLEKLDHSSPKNVSKRVI